MALKLGGRMATHGREKMVEERPFMAVKSTLRSLALAMVEPDPLVLRRMQKNMGSLNRGGNNGSRGGNNGSRGGESRGGGGSRGGDSRGHH